MLSRVEQDDGPATLINALKKNENLSDQWIQSAAKQLKVMTTNVDTFTGDVLYHQSCYNHFVYSYEEKSTAEMTKMTGKEIYVLSAEKEFKILLKRKILIENK